MTDYKKLIVGFGYRKGEASSWNGEHAYQGALKELARTACDNGADELLIWDRSQDDQDHEAVIGAIQETAREVDAPILAGGRVKRLEDVKKYLYAGASAVALDVSRQEEVDMMKEASDRFGTEKIYAWLPELSYLERVEEYAQLGASVMLVGTGTDRPSPDALEQIAGCSQRCLVFCSMAEEKDVPEGEAAEGEEPAAAVRDSGLSRALGTGQVQGAVLTLPETGMERVMALKQQLKAAGIPTDTFESSVDWSDFKTNADGLVPVVVQDYKTREVLMLAYMNEEAFQETLHTGRMTYFSRSRQSLWVKGETSGHFQYVKSLKLDCDNDTILATVKQVGAACHTGHHSCFFTTLAEKEYRETDPLKVFEEVYNVILDRKQHPKEGSYTNYLFDKGIDKILKKVGEEATEIVIAAKNPNPEEVKYEISDFLYHMMVLMAVKGIGWEEITEELANR